MTPLDLAECSNLLAHPDVQSESMAEKSRELANLGKELDEKQIKKVAKQNAQALGQVLNVATNANNVDLCVPATVQSDGLNAWKFALACSSL